jgi:hypothetical protein
MVISKNKLLSKEIENLKKLKKVEKRKKKYQIEASGRKGKGGKAIRRISVKEINLNLKHLFFIHTKNLL